MKKITIFFALLFSVSIQAQHIPDVNFANAIRQQCPTCINFDNDLTPASQNLTTLDVSFWNISDLTGLSALVSLAYFTCHNNQISNLPALPTGIISLVCSSNQLTSLPTLPAGLLYLHCQDNQLTSLPTLPTGLLDLRCQDNQLSSFPSMLSNIVHLNCSNNQLTSLPALSSALVYLYCSYNQLTTLPTLPSGVQELRCDHNQLSSLQPFMGGLYILDCNNNPEISCLPEINHEMIINFSGTSITCVPTHDYCINTSTPLIFNLPLCSPSDPCFVNTSIHAESLEKDKFELYPNPTSDLLWIDYDFAQTTENTLFLTDMLGRNVLSVKLTGSGKESVSLQGLANGIYQANLWNGEKWVSMGRVVKY